MEKIKKNLNKFLEIISDLKNWCVGDNYKHKADGKHNYHFVNDNASPSQF